ncbi:hypothetical protein SARC_00599 [Sphaeroforma arctica JP610]|uniref:Uncharacterized protein n=1 Tax=Sphaeroforma arctica JP610 TaxID=667725 RepID=A0A0L0GEF6_9EUKA|nr:hypothetical protein SARC_00599 [Sphaeroforma arctica JP610]KNC87271.1 hypothetical protein SARC_00599 [Sphaeroforma arctica JP610]|eukprot:XP_014161173.1 hypothetical protein SARC_00599 [Sphaeroforma arctica JP610]
MSPQKSKHLSGGRDTRHSLRGPDIRFRPVIQDEEYVETEATSDSDVDAIKNADSDARRCQVVEVLAEAEVRPKLPKGKVISFKLATIRRFVRGSYRVEEIS